MLNAARHNLREIQSELGAGGRIDATRTNQNEILAGAHDAAGVVALAQAMLADSGVDATTLRRDHVQAIELLFTLPPGHAIDDGRYFRQCLAWTGLHFRTENTLSAVIHRDEDELHMHVLALPLRDGRMRAGDLIDRTGLHKLRESFYRDVAKLFGLSKPPARLAGAARVSAVQAVFQALGASNDPVQRSALWLQVKQAIECDPAPYMAALGIEAIAPSRKPQKTMAQIFTSPGKGPNTERETKAIGFVDGEQKAIGFKNNPEKDRNLSCVGFANSAPSLSPQTEPIQPTQSRQERAREAMATGATRHHNKAPAPDADTYTREPADDFDTSAWQNDVDQLPQHFH